MIVAQFYTQVPCFIALIFFYPLQQCVSAYPDGAPAEACSSLTPMHGEHMSSDKTNPFMIDITEFRNTTDGNCYYYEPEKEYSITLTSSNHDQQFLGFLIQARRVKVPQSADDSSMDSDSMMDPAMIVGEFSDPEIGRYHSCDPTYGGVTHNLSSSSSVHDHHDHDHDHDDHCSRNSATFTWRAPAKDTGTISFRFTVVKQFNEFWANSETEMISEGGCSSAGSGAGTLKAAISMLLLCSVVLYYIS